MIRCGEKHALACDTGQTGGLEVCNDDDLAADKLVDAPFLLDGGHDRARLVRAVVQRQLQTAVGLADLLCLDDLADTQVDLCKFIEIDFVLDRRNFIGQIVRTAVVDSGGFFDNFRTLCFFFRHRIGEVQQPDILFGVDREQEQVQTRTLFLVDEQLVYILEERTLDALQLLVGSGLARIGENCLRDCVKLGVQTVQIVAALGNQRVQTGNLFLFFIGEGVVDLPVAGGAQTVDAFGRALFEPELCTVNAVFKVCLGIGRADLCKDGFEHVGIEVNDGAELDEQTHRDSDRCATLNLAVVKNGLTVFVERAFAQLSQHLVKFKILTQNAVVEAEVKCLERLGLGVEPQNDFRLVELEQQLGRHVQTGGTGHLTDLTLDADELIALEQRCFVAEDLAGNVLCVVVGAVQGSVILSAGLEVNALVHPAHRPVDLPCELAVEVCFEVEVTFVTAGTGVVRLGAVLGEGVDLGGVASADRAVDGNGVVCLTFTRLCFLGSVAVENVENASAFFQRMDDVLCVLAGAVHLGLMAVVHLDAEAFDGFAEFRLKVLCVGCVCRVLDERIGNVGVGLADVLFKIVADSGDVCRNLAHTVEFVPGEEQTRFFAHLAQCLYDEIRGSDITEITDVNAAGRADACRADIFFFVGVAFNDLERNFF